MAAIGRVTPFVEMAPIKQVSVRVMCQAWSRVLVKALRVLSRVSPGLGLGLATLLAVAIFAALRLHHPRSAPEATG